MKQSDSYLRLTPIVLLLGLTGFGFGCSGGGGTTQPAEPKATATGAEATGSPQAKTTEADAKTTEAEVTPAEAPETFPVPEGTPDELFAFLESLSSKEPPARDEQSMQQFITKLGHTVILATDRILAAKPTEQQASEAVKYKLAGIGLLDQAGDDTANALRDALPAELEKAGLGSLVRIVTIDKFINRFQKLGGKKEAEAFADEFVKFLQQSPPNPEEIGLAMQFAGQLEFILEPEQVAAFYENCGKAFAGHEDEQVAEMAKMMIGSGRRMRLVGNEMPLEGITLDGQELEWDKYKGKVVLVDFWATWCGPCIEEMDNIRANYEKYHDLGFDVIGINEDDSRDALASFLKTNELPWAIVFDNALEEAGRETMAERYGIMAYPTVMLVGKDGKVVAMNTRGPELGQRLEELLGKPTPPTEPSKEPAKETGAEEPEVEKPAAEEVTKPEAEKPAAEEANP